MAVTSGGNIRISEKSRESLRELARREKKPMQSVLEEALEAYRRQKFLDDANAAFAALRKDPKAWAHELQEREVWDKTVGDGIEDE